MNATQLLAHFDRLAESPNAVPRLRRFILDLAVRGKLVAQDAGDEPAATLINRIEAEKSRLVRAGLVSKQEVFVAKLDADTPFRIPNAWAWVPATFPAFMVSDLGKKVQTKEVLPAGEFPVVDQGKVFIRGYCNDQDKVIRVAAPLILFGDHTRETKLIDFDFVVGADGVKLLQPVCLFTSYYFLSLEWLPLNSRGYGRHFKLLKSAYIPLPPLPEQHRIVAKVDELMALCDQLEAAQQERERRRDRLAAASLQRLNQPTLDATPAAQREHARFYLQHLPRLSTRPEHIKAMRQAILNLAVCGALSDSSEWSLYSQPLKVAATLQNGYAFKSEWFAKTGIRLLRNTNVSHGVIRWDELACLPTEQADEFERFKLLEGDVVLSLDRPFIGSGTKVARVRTGDLPCLLLQRVGRFQLNPDLLTSDYLFLWIKSPQFTDQIDPGRSNGVPHISSKQVECAEIFLPPLAEQHRIVAKVDELMALCDQLEAQLTTTQTDSRRLLEAVLEAALATA